MNILITIPDFSRHGGIRIIIEWANRLSHWHDVTLFTQKPQRPSWINISKAVTVTNDPCFYLFDCLIITSPHHIHLQDLKACPKKVFIFMQMVESMFRPHDEAWQAKCKAFYTSPHCMFAISLWNIEAVQNEYGRTGEVIYVGNGVNLNDFPICTKLKDGKTILIENWESSNPSKDSKRLGPMAAQKLKSYGYRIIAYGSHPIKTMKHVPHEYYCSPTLAQLNSLYERATILLKASKYDARSCSSLEAATKGTVTARAIILGDDDLIHDHNCLRSDYKLQPLIENARRLLKDGHLRQRLADNYLKQIQEQSWDYWIKIINERICQ